jgi:hypothetical protein
MTGAPYYHSKIAVVCSNYLEHMPPVPYDPNTAPIELPKATGYVGELIQAGWTWTTDKRVSYNGARVPVCPDCSRKLGL